MRVKYSPAFLSILKRVDVRIRKSLRESIAIFIRNPNDLELDNHDLRDEWLGYRSIDVTENWRALYKEITENDESVAYFIALGTHDGLYGKGRRTA